MIHRILGILIITACLFGAWFWMTFKQFADMPLNLPSAGVIYNLPAGTSVSSLAQDLERKGYLAKPLYLRLLARVEGHAQRIKAGEYRLQAGLTPRELLSLLVSGKVTSYSITLVEGWNLRQVKEALLHHPALMQTIAEISDEEIMRRLDDEIEQRHLEGRFLPDTYHFPKGDTDLSVLKRAYRAMQIRLDQEWQQREPSLPLKNSYEALILASIIEKETGVVSERPEIAGVFIRRLNKGMKLQTDPTVIYGLGERFDGNIRRRDLLQKTPYNTYVNKGLPPTPICMPGAEAIRAALHPKPGKSLYFVAKGGGYHHFSTTLKEHNRAVRKYQLKK